MLTAQAALEVGLIDVLISTEEMLDILEGHQPPPPASEKPILAVKWCEIANFYEQNSYRNNHQQAFHNYPLLEIIVAH